jgi:STE24 endopeptidase
MKALFAVSAMILVFLILTTQFVPPTQEVIDQAGAYFSRKEMNDGSRYAQARRWVFWGRVAVEFLFLSGLALLPIGRRIQRAVGERVGFRWLPQIVILGAIAWLGLWLIDLPFGLAAYFVACSWGMSNLSPLGWLGEMSLGFLIETIAAGVPFVCLYGLMRQLPKFWWLAAGVGSMLLGVLFALILPEVIAPLFNTFTPLAKSKYADKFPNMKMRLRALGEPLGIENPDIYVVDASRQSNHSNAYFTGVGSRQQIVLYDNLLAKHSSDEIETVVAHEMGHWYWSHILYGILYGGIALTIGLFLLDRILAPHVHRGEWRSIADPAGVFLVLWFGWIATAAIQPIERAVSRRFERQADQVSLDMSKKPKAFIDAEINMAKENIMDVAPLPWNVLLFATHPTVIERINMAKEWKDWK